MAGVDLNLFQDHFHKFMNISHIFASPTTFSQPTKGVTLTTPRDVTHLLAKQCLSQPLGSALSQQVISQHIFCRMLSTSSRAQHPWPGGHTGTQWHRGVSVYTLGGHHPDPPLPVGCPHQLTPTAKPEGVEVTKKVQHSTHTRDSFSPELTDHVASNCDSCTISA